VGELLVGAFEALTEDLHVAAHGALLLVEEVFVLAGKFGEGVTCHEGIQLVQAVGCLPGFVEESFFLFGAQGGVGWVRRRG